MIVSPELLEQLTKMAGFRNLIVHGYAHIDDAAVFGILKQHMEDFDAFAQAIIAHIDDE